LVDVCDRDNEEARNFGENSNQDVPKDLSDKKRRDLRRRWGGSFPKIRAAVRALYQHEGNSKK